MCNKCSKCGKKNTMISVGDDEILKRKYDKYDDMQYGCVCKNCGMECCLCV